LTFKKAQYSLLHVLSENFGMHDKQIIADHDPVQLVEKLKVKHTVAPCSRDRDLEFLMISPFIVLTETKFIPDKPGWTPTKW